MIDFSARGRWATDTFHQLIIFAHVLEATWKALPPPFHRLRPFYLAAAKAQTEIIQKKVQERSGIDKVLTGRYPDDIKQRFLGRNGDASVGAAPVTEEDE